MRSFQRYAAFLLIHISTCFSFPQILPFGPKTAEDPSVQGTSDNVSALRARQAFIRDCQPWQEQAIIASTQQLAAVVLEGVLASEHRVLYDEVDEPLRRIFDNMWLQTRPSAPDDQISVHYVLQRVWDAAYFTFSGDQAFTVPGTRIPPGQGVRITCQDVQNRCRGLRPLYITHRRGEDQGLFTGGNTIVICESFYGLPDLVVRNLMEPDQGWHLFEAFALNPITIPNPMGTLAPNRYGRRLAYPYYIYAKATGRIELFLIRIAAGLAWTTLKQVAHIVDSFSKLLAVDLLPDNLEMDDIPLKGLAVIRLASKACLPGSHKPAADDIESQNPADPALQAPCSRTRPTAFLDGLRGLAAFLVYVSHHISWFYGAEDAIQYGFGDTAANGHFATLPFVRILFTGGNPAVAIFFVLSGYVLSKSPLRRLRDATREESYRGLLSAAIRRPVRLFIAPAGVSLAFALTMQLPLGLAPRLTWPESKDTIFGELANWWLELCRALNPFEPHGIYTRWFPYDPPIWTIAIEYAGSMLVFFLVAISSYVKPWTRFLSFIVTGTCLFCFYEWAMACFIAGVVLAINDLEVFESNLLIKRVQGRTRLILYHAIFISGCFLLSQPSGTRDPSRSLNALGWYYLTLLIPRNYYDAEYWRFWNTVGAAMLVFSVLRIRWLQKGLASPPLRYLGRVSFSLYLIHIPFLWTVGDRIYRIFGACRPELQTWFDNWLRLPDIGPRGLSVKFVMTQAFILPLCLVVSEIGTIVLDEPSVKAGRWIVERLGLHKRG
ncbi:MAG: hypothetical protein Q9160_005846 [Pyrenula sp. 1 TL-2023]